jgi:hypothetical protein
MSRFSDQEKAAIFRRSRELLERDGVPSTPPPTPESPPLVFESEMDRWRREADEFEQKRAAAKAALRREERDIAHAHTLEARIAELEQRVAAVEQRDDVAEFAKASAEFSDKTLQALDRLEQLCAELSGKLTELRAADDLHRVVDPPKLVRRAN